jgi:hypothetical protein
MDQPSLRARKRAFRLGYSWRERGRDSGKDRGQRGVGFGGGGLGWEWGWGWGWGDCFRERHWEVKDCLWRSCYLMWLDGWYDKGLSIFLWNCFYICLMIAEKEIRSWPQKL